MGAHNQFSAFIPGFKARLDKVTGIRETRALAEELMSGKVLRRKRGTA